MVSLASLTLAVITAFGWSYNTPTYITSGDQKPDPAIVAVYAPGGRGTGFFIKVGETKYLVTAAHVCGTSPMVLTMKGIHKVLVSKPERDICVATTYQSVEALPLGKDVKYGDQVDMTGFPGNLIYDHQSGTARDVGLTNYVVPPDLYTTDGTCPAYSQTTEAGCVMFITTIELQILARPGNSGGPVQNANGEVVGIIIATDFTYGYMAPVSELVNLINGAP